MRRRLSYSNLDANRRFLKLTGKLKKNGKILEIGSGNGLLLNRLTKQGFDIVGTDFNEKYVETARKLYKEVQIKQMSGDNITYPDKAFDVVISFDVFEHITDTKRHLSEVKRVLKPGGYYIFCTPNKYTNIPWEILRYRSLIRWAKYHTALHSYWQLKNALIKAGFKPEFYDIKVVNNFFLNKIRKIFGSVGVRLVKILNPDNLPIPFRTNYYVVAQNV